MVYIKHRVTRNENINEIANRYGTNVQVLVFLNRNRYPTLIDNSNIVFEGWQLIVPLVTIGGNTNPEQEVW